jgi:hypothetical protein
MAKGTAALDSFSTLADNITQLVGDVREEGVIPKAAAAVAAASDIVIEVENGSGLLHSLIYDDYPGGGIDSIETSLAHLESILADTSHRGTADLVVGVQERFGLTVHPRSIERALARRKKKLR